MPFFISNFKWVMFIAGLLTCTTFIGVFSPEFSLKYSFGEEFRGGADNIIVRNWSALIGLIGILLIYGAFKPAAREIALILAIVSKVLFITLVLLFGRQYLGFGTGVAVIVDCIMVFLMVFYLLFSRPAWSE